METYADRLAQTTTQLANFRNYRHCRPQQFFDICKFHLSLLVDLPIEFNYCPPLECIDSTADPMQDEPSRRSRPWTRLAASMKHQHRGKIIILTVLNRLFHYLRNGCAPFLNKVRGARWTYMEMWLD